MIGEVDIVDNATDIAAVVVSVAAVLTALGVIYKKTKDASKLVRLKFAEQIGDVVFDHPSFKHIYDDVNVLRSEVAVINREVTLNGGSSLKDKVNQLAEGAAGFSVRLGNVEQQVEQMLLMKQEEKRERDLARNAKEGDRGNPDHPPVSEFGP